jgi:hypothetical protein
MAEVNTDRRFDRDVRSGRSVVQRPFQFASMKRGVDLKAAMKKYHPREGQSGD